MFELLSIDPDKRPTAAQARVIIDDVVSKNDNDLPNNQLSKRSVHNFQPKSTTDQKIIEALHKTRSVQELRLIKDLDIKIEENGKLDPDKKEILNMKLLNNSNLNIRNRRFRIKKWTPEEKEKMRIKINNHPQLNNPGERLVIKRKNTNNSNEILTTNKINIVKGLIAKQKQEIENLAQEEPHHKKLERQQEQKQFLSKNSFIIKKPEPLNLDNQYFANREGIKKQNEVVDLNNIFEPNEKRNPLNSTYTSEILKNPFHNSSDSTQEQDSGSGGINKGKKILKNNASFFEPNGLSRNPSPNEVNRIFLKKNDGLNQPKVLKIKKRDESQRII
jgi:hypothetical protein